MSNDEQKRAETGRTNSTSTTWCDWLKNNQLLVFIVIIAIAIGCWYWYSQQGGSGTGSDLNLTPRTTGGINITRFRGGYY